MSDTANPVSEDEIRDSSIETLHRKSLKLRNQSAELWAYSKALRNTVQKQTTELKSARHKRYWASMGAVDGPVQDAPSA